MQEVEYITHETGRSARISQTFTVSKEVDA